MDLSKVVWIVVIAAIAGGVWLFTDGGMNKAYEEATKNLVGNDPDQDVIDEAILSKYGDTCLGTFRYDKAKKFYKAATERYGINGKNYWWNMQQLAKAYEKSDNEAATIGILYMIWQEDGDAYDERVSSRPQLKARLTKLVELNGLDIRDYPMEEIRR
jgi:hypothetical protein